MQKSVQPAKTDHDPASSISQFLAKKNRHRKKPVLSWVFFSPPSSQAKSMIEIDFARESAMCGVQKRMPTDWERRRKKRRPIGVLSFTPSKIFPFGGGREKEVCVCADFLAHDSEEERKGGGGESVKFWIQHGISHTFHFAAQIGKYAPSNALESALTSALEEERVYIRPTVYFRKCLYSMKKRREITACRRTLLQKKVPAGSSSSSFR